MARFIEEQGGDAICVKADVSKSSDVQQMIATTLIETDSHCIFRWTFWEIAVTISIAHSSNGEKGGINEGSAVRDGEGSKTGM